MITVSRRFMEFIWMKMFFSKWACHVEYLFFKCWCTIINPRDTINTKTKGQYTTISEKWFCRLASVRHTVPADRLHGRHFDRSEWMENEPVSWLFWCWLDHQTNCRSVLYLINKVLDRTFDRNTDIEAVAAVRIMMLPTCKNFSLFYIYYRKKFQSLSMNN